MPQDPKTYTVRDKQTGKTVTFKWNQTNPPTDADFEEVFGSAGLRAQQTPSDLPLEGTSRRDEIEQRFSTPFSTLAAGQDPRTQAAASILDVPMKAFTGIARGAEKVRTAFTAPNALTGVLEGAQGLGQMALPAVFPLSTVGLTGAFEAAPPWLQGAMSAVSQPATTIFQPETRQGRAIAGIADVAAGFGVLKGGQKVAQRFSPAARAERGIRSGRVKFGKAFPAATKELDRPHDIARIEKYLGEEQRLSPVTPGDMPRGGLKPSVARQLAEEKFPAIKQKIWDSQQEIINRNADAPLAGGGNVIGNAVEKLRNIYSRFVDEAADKSIIAEAEKYRNIPNITVKQATELLRSLNAELDNFYKKSTETQAATQNAVKPIAEMERAARAIRESIAQTLKDRGEDVGFYRSLHEDYGAAARLKTSAEAHIVRSETPPRPIFTEATRGFTLAPTSFGAEIGQHTIGRFFTPDKLATRAMKKFGKFAEKPQLTPPAQTYAPKGLLGAGAIRLGSQVESPMNVSTGIYDVPIDALRTQRLALPPPRGIPPSPGNVPPSGARPIYPPPGEGSVVTPEMTSRGVVYRTSQGSVEAMIRNAGAEPIGMQGGLVLFNDPVTGSTLAMKISEITPEAVAQKIAASRAKFGK